MEPRTQLAEVPQGQNYSGEEHSHLHVRVLRFKNTVFPQLLQWTRSEAPSHCHQVITVTLE